MTATPDKPDEPLAVQVVLRCQECGRELRGCYHMRDGVAYCLMCASGKCEADRDIWSGGGE